MLQAMKRGGGWGGGGLLGGFLGRGAGPSYIDISLIGDKELQRKLNKLARDVQIRLLGSAMKNTGNKILRAPIAAAVPVKSGRLKAAMGKQKFKIFRGKTSGARLEMPPRAALGIDPQDKYYYPVHVEYGHGNVPPHSFLRKPVDENAARWRAAVGAELGRKIEAEARK